ncbi:SAPS-domain-containing protein [Ascobolus immersus RN42]|uniref:SAPS-domain-containing protein n=1 Tax=Ascobolus immersus RN42 TaxID=1160509 RepID=A0A3N4I4X2_ASCIM|nr:SAPS-domain-containing protein [Ascobolus immersus RN42]
MFWKFSNYANLSTIDTLLDKPDVTLEELLGETDLIQELKHHNTKLIEYLRDDRTLEKMLKYVIEPPIDSPTSPTSSEPSASESSSSGLFGARFLTKSNEDETNDREARSKYALTCCEVLSSDTWSIAEALMENIQLLHSFWKYLDNEPPLDALRASYFTKVNESLLERKTEDMIRFFKSIPNVVPKMLKHIDCPMVMDLLLKIISVEKSEGGAGIVDWLQSQDLIPNLLSFLSPSYPSATQTSTGNFLKAVITISANASQNDQSCIGPNNLTRQLVSESSIKFLIGEMLKGGNPLTVGVEIVIEVIRKNNSDYDPDILLGNLEGPAPQPSGRDPIYLGTLLRLFASHVPDFMKLILERDHVTVSNSDGTKTEVKRELKTASGRTIEPLGFDRFKTCELMAELLHCSNMGLLNERGGERYIKARDTERDRLRRESERQQDGKSQADESSGADDTRGRLEVQNGDEMDLDSQGSQEDDFEELAYMAAEEDTIRKLLEVATIDETSQSAKEGMASAEMRGNGGLTVIERNGKVVITDTSKETRPGDDSSVVEESTLTSKDEDNFEEISISVDKPITVTVGRTEADPEEKIQPLSIDKDKAGNVQPLPPVAASVNRLNAELPPLPSDLDGKHLPPVPDAPTGEFSGSSGANDSSFPTGEAFNSLLEGSGFTEYGAMLEEDVDGGPVVGDYLKMMFVEHSVVPTILNFFFRFPWNNFLHNVVYDFVQQVFNGPMDKGYNRTLAIDLFETGRITERIVEGQRASDQSQKEHNMRLGYMGHLTLIAEEVVRFTDRYSPELLSREVLEKVTSKGWVDYVERTLAETRERDNAILGGVRPDVSIMTATKAPLLNAITPMQSFGGGGGTGAGLDTIELVQGSSTGIGTGLLSGFGSSSDEDEEDGDREDEEDDEEGRLGRSNNGSKVFISFP